MAGRVFEHRYRGERFQTREGQDGTIEMVNRKTKSRMQFPSGTSFEKAVLSTAQYLLDNAGNRLTEEEEEE